MWGERWRALFNSIVWTALSYNPVRISGVLIAWLEWTIAVAIWLAALVALSLSGVNRLGSWACLPCSAG